jgi:hypothetical protein
MSHDRLLVSTRELLLSSVTGVVRSESALVIKQLLYSITI